MRADLRSAPCKDYPGSRTPPLTQLINAKSAAGTYHGRPVPYRIWAIKDDCDGHCKRRFSQ